MPRLSLLLLLPALGALAQSASSTYDYIVAGAGPAGIIVAQRLAESGASVILLERGNASTYSSGGRDILPWNNSVTQYDVPGVRHYIKTSFADKSEYCTDTAGNAGCILGGSTMVNQLAYIPPQNLDFDGKWPVGWKWADVASAAERVRSRNPGSTCPSADGIRYDQTSYTAFANFFDTQGFNSVDAIAEPNLKHNVYSHAPYSVKDGLVAGPVLTYLPLAQALPNFKLQLHTRVVRAVRNGPIVSGVEVEVNGERQIINVSAGGRVILASGVFSTPRILFNSGIGPSDQLQIVAGSATTTNITLPSSSDWINLPVGRGIKDHVIVTLNFNTTGTVDFLDTPYFISPSLNATDMYSHGAGILTQGYQRLTMWTSNATSDGSTRFFQVYIRSSPQRNEAFKQAQKDHPLLKKVCELHTFNDTRWNSVFDALRVFIHVRPAIDDFYHTTLREWQDYENEKTDFGSKPRPERMRKKPTVLSGFITQDDWVILTRYHEILEPIWQFTQRLEGHGAGASHGIIWQVIPAMERLLAHLERLRKQYGIVELEQDYSAVPLIGSQIPASQSAMVSQIQSQASQLIASSQPQDEDPTPSSRPLRAYKKARKNKTTLMAPPPRSPSPSPHPPPSFSNPIEQTIEYRMLATGVNLAWKKLDHYYQVTDRSPVYVAAVVLHPAYTWRWIRSKWKGRQDWIIYAQQAVKQFWLKHYAYLKVDMPKGEDPTNATLWMDADITSEEEEASLESSETDEYAKWCFEGRVPDVYHPLEFWSKSRIKHTYPRLSRMARDLFTIPAMSDEPERVFSSCGNMVTAQRGSLGADAIEEAQCVKSWMKNGVITNLGATFEAVSARPEEAMIL
jgi:glycine/D-amino acid oxidase-like deaminating enzyme